MNELVTHYDINEDGMLDYKEFMDIVLPKEHPNLRAFVTQKECFDITHDEYLSYESEAALVDLLDNEITLLADLVPEKVQLDQLGLDGKSVIELVDV